MKLATPARSRAGFTLVEMLVVLAIIAILLALSGAAYQKAADSQRNRSTDDLMNRLQPALDAEYDAVVNQCRKDRLNNQIPQAVVNYCNNDMDRAQALWTCGKLIQNFPQNFTEATSLIVVCPPTSTNTASFPTTYSLSPLSTFTQFSGMTGGTTDQQSAVLLYAILSKKSSGGSGGFAADDVTSGMQMDVSGFTNSAGQAATARAFRDSWHNPICFIRWWQGTAGTPSATEIQNPPYVSAAAATSAAAGNGGADPLDPLNAKGTPKMFSWTTLDTSTIGQVDGAPLLMHNSPYLFNGLNRTATVWSYGKDGKSELLLPASDDRAGFRLRRLGNKANQGNPGN